MKNTETRDLIILITSKIDVKDVFSSTKFANLIPAKTTKEVGFSKIFQIVDSTEL